jgi:hypothetical protein
VQHRPGALEERSESRPAQRIAQAMPREDRRDLAQAAEVARSLEGLEVHALPSGLPAGDADDGAYSMAVP